MRENFRYTLLSILRNPPLLFWPLGFPIIMSLMFAAMFANLDESFSLQPASIGVVNDQAYQSARNLDETLQAVSGLSENEDMPHIMDLTYYDDSAKAETALMDGSLDGYIQVIDETPELYLSPSGTSEEGRMRLSAVTTVLDAYIRTRHEMETVMQESPTQPSVYEQSGAIERFQSDVVRTERLQLTRTDPDPVARYYYAMLGMAAGYGMSIACVVIQSLNARSGALGARRTLAALPRWRMLASSLIAAWLVSFLCLVISLMFMRYVVGVDFGDRLLLCIGAIGISSLLFCVGGALCGSIPSFPQPIISAITGLLSFFAGLYGSLSQHVADGFAAQHPLLTAANPIRQTAQLFYSLLYYNSLIPYARICASLTAMTACLALAAAWFMRRQQHAHL